MGTPLIEVLQTTLQQAPSNLEIKSALETLFKKSHYGCQKAYPLAVVHEKTRITDPAALAFFAEHNLLDHEGFTPGIYEDAQIEQIVLHAPAFIQRADYIVAKSKAIPTPTFFNKFKHDYWKKIQSVDGLEAVIDVTLLNKETTTCETEASLRAIIRKRKEVHQLKKLSFVWIAEVDAENSAIETVLQHYFKEDHTTIKHKEKVYYMGWSTPLQSINMRYFVCPPE